MSDERFDTVMEIRNHIMGTYSLLFTLYLDEDFASRTTDDTIYFGIEIEDSGTHGYRFYKLVFGHDKETGKMSRHDVVEFSTRQTTSPGSVDSIIEDLDAPLYKRIAS